jgi:allophanate hydrolase
MSTGLASLGFDLQSLRAAYGDGLAPEAVVSEVFRRIKAADDPGIFITLCDEDAVRAAARALGRHDPSKPLWGVPFAIKDNIDLAHVETTAACPGFAFVPQQHATCVRLLIEAGALPIGKTNLDQFATGLVGVRTPYGAPRNSFDPLIVPGGSSSGSAVAVARGLVSFALGTDTAGSGRVPAGLNNLVGLKPTLGAISTAGVLPACRTLDCVSIFALTVGDAQAVFQEVCAYDASDPYSRPVHQPAISAPPPKMRIGIPDDVSLTFGGDELARASFSASIDALQAAGFVVQKVDMRLFFDTARLLYEGPWVAERYAAIRDVMEHRADILHPVTRAILQNAEKFSAADTFAAQYKLQELRRLTEPVWRDIDVLLTPTYPRPRSVADLAADPIGPNSELGTYTNFVNLLDLCALAVPAGFRRDGFPGSVTLIAPAGRDGALAGLGALIQAQGGASLGATGLRPEHLDNRAPAATQAAGDEIEIVVVGAHLSGMALNHELTDANARFLRATTTQPDYRLFALAGGPPRRPGLLRVDPQKGFSIAVEVWAMPADQFGRFVARIPAPLGFAKIKLADGTAPSGFIAEAIGVEGAEDISSLGGWRAYMSAGPVSV